MATQLGDYLLQKGFITNEDLEEALQYQVIYGGKLGTNLLEMGLIDEEELTTALTKVLGTPAVDPKDLQNISPEVLKLIPEATASAFRCLPVKVEGRRLLLVMEDPNNLQAIDEISFKTGLIVKPLITPEVRFIAATERYYNISRQLRYVDTGHSFVQKKRVRNRKKAEPELKSAPPPPSAAEFEIPLAEHSLDESVPEDSPAVVVAPAKVAPLEIDFEDAVAIGAEQEAGGAVATPPVAAPLRPAADAVEEPEELDELEELEELQEESFLPATLEEYTFEKVSELLAMAEDREEIAELMIGYLANRYDRCALFLIRGGQANGWRAMFAREEVAAFTELEIPLDEPSVLKTVAETRSFYLGQIGRSPFNSMIFQALGGQLPDSALLVPLVMMGRVVSVAYVDSKGVDLSQQVADLQQITNKASMAFEILVLKNKIRMM
ncbi:MAG: hypothetical protein P1P74_02615 [Desulfuromonadales bacterium]|nr:hypothetical protein [Desulfuromonadales bacterium]